MILFTFPIYLTIGSELIKLRNVRQGQFIIDYFPNGEMFASIKSEIEGEQCLILGSSIPSDKELFSTLLLGHTLKKWGACRVVTLIPYLSYLRQDKEKLGESLATHWLGALFEASKIDEVVTIDVHSQLDKELFPIPLISISPASVFAQKITELDLLDASIVAPDEGAVVRAEAVRAIAGMQGSIIFFEKERTEKGLELKLNNGVGPQAVIIDDILDTGETLVKCCRILRQEGAEEITIMVTHGLFTGNLWQKLFDLGVKHIYITDTVPLAPHIRQEKISVLSIIDLIKNYLKGKYGL